MVNERIIILGAISDWLIVGPVWSANSRGGASDYLFIYFMFRLLIQFNNGWSHLSMHRILSSIMAVQVSSTHAWAARWCHVFWWWNGADDWSKVGFVCSPFQKELDNFLCRYHTRVVFGTTCARRGICRRACWLNRCLHRHMTSQQSSRMPLSLNCQN